MMDPTEIEHGDCVRINCEPFVGALFDVDDTRVEDIGFTEVFAVSLVDRVGDVWTLSGATHSDAAEMEHIESGQPFGISVGSTEVLY